MNTISKSSLDDWIKEQIGDRTSKELSREALDRCQIDRLRETAAHAVNESPFYRKRLDGFAPDRLKTRDDVALLPFTTEEDLRSRSLEMLCVSQSEVARVVTIGPPGDPYPPKRLYFTDEDHERTVDFFRQGMSMLVEPGQKVLILLPGNTPGGVGDLLAKGLDRMGAEGIVHGLVTDPVSAVNEAACRNVDCLVGIPSQVFAMARTEEAKHVEPGRIKIVLLSADYVPQPVVDAIEDRWKCAVFEHYGTVEMGLGGGVHCSVHRGYHFREADLFVEVVDPVGGKPLPDGETGEVVFSTLTRKAMPLIRYKTGDLARFIPGACPCGSVLKRLGKVRGRLKERIDFDGSIFLSVAELDEVVFFVEGVIDYRAEIERGGDTDRLKLSVHCRPGESETVVRKVKEAVERMPVVRRLSDESLLAVDPVAISPESWPTDGVMKRTIIDRRREFPG